VWAAAIIGCIVSGVDGTTMRIDVSDSVYPFVSFISMPGALGAWYLNLLLHGGHSVTSAAREFFFSLPCNAIAYWMFIRACAGIVWILFPTKASK
jgi:hypothetical protein